MLLAASMGGPLTAQSPSVDQLAEIAALLERNDIAALRSYLAANPGLLNGETEIAALLRQFYEESDNVNAFLGFLPALRDVIGTPNFEDGPQQSASDATDGFAPAAGSIY